MKRSPQVHGLALLGNWAELLAVSRAVPIGTGQTRNCVGWKEAVVPLLFPFLSLVWFLVWLNSHSLEVVSLLLSFSFPSSSLPKTSSQSWGALVLGWTCRAWCAPLYSHTKLHSFPHTLSALLTCVSLATLLMRVFAASHPWAHCLLFFLGNLRSAQPWGQRDTKGHFRFAGRRVGLWLTFFSFLLI